MLRMNLHADLLFVITSQDTVTSELWSPRSVIARNDSRVSRSSPAVSSLCYRQSAANKGFKVQLPKAETSASVPSVIRWCAGKSWSGAQL